MKVSQDMWKKNATNSNLKLCHLNGDKAMEMWLVQSDKVCRHVLKHLRKFSTKIAHGTPKWLGIFTLYQGKSPSNHHLGEYVFTFSSFSKHVKQIQNEGLWDDCPFSR